MRDNTMAFLVFTALLMLPGCKKEEKEKEKTYDECGNEIRQEQGYGGVGMPPPVARPATAYIWVKSGDHAAMTEAVRVYNAEDPTQYTDIASAMDDDLGPDHFCGNTTNGNVARFAIVPGSTLHWKAFNASHTKNWEDTLRNPSCEDGTDCYSARITYPW